MAQQKSVTLIDDLDGGKAAETITFGLDGASYEIDLSKKNATALRKAVADFVEHGRRVKAGAAPAKAQRPPVPRQGPTPRRYGSGQPPRASPSPPAAGSRQTSSHSTRPRSPDPWHPGSAGIWWSHRRLSGRSDVTHRYGEPKRSTKRR